MGRMEINPSNRLVKVGGGTSSTAYPANIPSIADVEAAFSSDGDNDSSDEDDVIRKYLDISRHPGVANRGKGCAYPHQIFKNATS